MARLRPEQQEEYRKITEQIGKLIDKIDETDDDGQQELYLRQLEQLERTRRENYTFKNEEQEAKERKFERGLKIGRIVIEGIGLLVPIGLGIYTVKMSRKNLVDLLEYELTGHVTSAAGKQLIPRALKI